MESRVMSGSLCNHRSNRSRSAVPLQYAHITGTVTKICVRLFGDIDLDGQVDDDDRAAAPGLPETYGWGMPAATNAFRLVRLSTQSRLGGTHTLSLKGDEGAFRIWATASPAPTNSPLLVCGRTVTNGVNGADFAGYPGRDLYVEAVSNGTATLTYAYRGTGGAAGISCEAALKMTAWGMNLCPVELDTNGYPVVENGKVIPGENIGWDGTLLSTYAPVTDRGSPQIEAVLGTANNWTVFEPAANGAVLTITRSGMEGYKTWDLELVGTTNGVTTYLWSEGTNSFVRAEWTNSVQGTTIPLRLTLKDADFTGTDEEVETEIGLCTNENLPGYYSNYAVFAPREDIGRPAFSERNAFVVRFNPHGAALEGLTCEITTEGEGGETVSVPLAQGEDGVYTSILIVPVAEIDAESDLGLESSVGAVMLKIKGGTGGQKVTINIGSVIGGTMKKIATGQMNVRHAMLLSCLVSNEENGRARASQSVTAAGETAISRLKYGVTPLFSPDKQQINDMLARHRVWIHSGHGGNAAGIRILSQSAGAYQTAYFKASDITASGLDYDLVFMNTCESTDVKWVPITPTPQAVSGWVSTNMPGHAVMDIGTTLNAKNYVGWDCEIVRQLSVQIPDMLMQALDTTQNGITRTIDKAVEAIQDQMDNESPKRDYYYYGIRLRAVRYDTTTFDLNRKGL